MNTALEGPISIYYDCLKRLEIALRSARMAGDPGDQAAHRQTAAELVEDALKALPTSRFPQRGRQICLSWQADGGLILFWDVGGDDGKQRSIPTQLMAMANMVFVRGGVVKNRYADDDRGNGAR